MIPDSFEEMTLAWDQTPCSVVGLFAPDHLEMGRNPTEAPIFVVVWDERESKWSSPPLSLKGYSGGAITKSNIILYLFLNGLYCMYSVSKLDINFICSSKRIQLKYLKSSYMTKCTLIKLWEQIPTECQRKIFQNVYFRPDFRFQFFICLVFPGIPLVKTTKMSKIHNCIFQIQISPWRAALTKTIF